MTRTLQRRPGVLIAAAASALVSWWFIPGTAIDRAAFATVATGFANPPLFISGNGSHADPWKLRTFVAKKSAAHRQAPVIVSLGDDVEGFFQGSPPSPIDFAVIFSNFQRLGEKNVASAAVLAWDAPDPIGLMALDQAIGRFDSMVMAAPLSRGAVPEPIPPAFRRASIPLTQVRGNSRSLPVVNRIPINGIILGGENTLAGFQTLESERETTLPPVIARWEDRIVFAFPLLVVLNRLDLPVDGVEIRTGKHIKLGPDGPVLPLDRYGRLDKAPMRIPPLAVRSAESLIDAPAGFFPEPALKPVILRDDRSAAEPSTRTFSRDLPSIIATIASAPSPGPVRAYPRLSTGREIVFIFIVAIGLMIISELPEFSRHIMFAGVASICLAAQWTAAGTAHLWLPGIHLLAAILAAFAASHQLGLKSAPPMSPSVPPPAPNSGIPGERGSPRPSKRFTQPATDIPGKPHKTPVTEKSGPRQKKRRR